MPLYKPGRPSKKDPPQAPGEYRWRNKETGKVEYIGETNNLSRRKSQHETSEKAVSSKTHDFEWKKADGRSASQTRRDHERASIEKHAPVLNERNGGGGRKVGK